MRVTVIAPTTTRAFVERFTIIETEIEETRTLLPEPGLHLGVRYRGAATLVEGDREALLGDLVVTGLRASARTIRTHAQSGIVVALFKPTGAARVFPVPLHELFGTTVGLDALVGACVLADRIRAASTDRERVTVVEDFLLACEVQRSPRAAGVDAASRAVDPAAAAANRPAVDALLAAANRTAVDPLVEAAVARLVTTHGRLRITDLADELDISQDPLEKRFRRIVGGSPKQLACILRITRAIELAQEGVSLASVAHQGGYFDQSHFIREFRAVTGQAPGKFFRDADFC